jgi:hypothetical protein
MFWIDCSFTFSREGCCRNARELVARPGYACAGSGRVPAPTPVCWQQKVTGEGGV